MPVSPRGGIEMGCCFPRWLVEHSGGDGLMDHPRSNLMDARTQGSPHLPDTGAGTLAGWRFGTPRNAPATQEEARARRLLEDFQRSAITPYRSSLHCDIPLCKRVIMHGVGVPRTWA